MNAYGTTAALSQYLLFHFGKPSELMPFSNGPGSGVDYPARYVRLCVDGSALPRGARALDLGCGVGGITFELARGCQEVLGIDLSRRFIAAARTLQRNGRVQYRRVEEGVLTTPAVARVPRGIDRSRVRFETGDALSLRADIGTFDLVVLANLLDRVSDPVRCLRQMPVLVRPGGLLVVSSPYTWLTDHTPRARWLGGVVRGGREVSTHDSLSRALASGFELVRRVDVPFTIRDHARKFQWAVADATVWKRNASDAQVRRRGSSASRSPSPT